MALHFDAVVIEGLGARMPIESRYSYAKDKCRCPACGGVGIPWMGWFSCEICAAVALIETGECFVPCP